MASPLFLATKEKQIFSLNTYKKTSHSALRYSVAGVPVLATHTRPPNKKNKTLEDHILLEPYVLSNESHIKLVFNTPTHHSLGLRLRFCAWAVVD